MKKNRDEPFGVIIHLYMKLSQGNSLCSYRYLKKETCLFFLFFLLQNQRRAKQVLLRGVGLAPEGAGRCQGKEGEYCANTVYTCM
jgi:hypothetical protein